MDIYYKVSRLRSGGQKVWDFAVGHLGSELEHTGKHFSGNKYFKGKVA